MYYCIAYCGRKNVKVPLPPGFHTLIPRISKYDITYMIMVCHMVQWILSKEIIWVGRVYSHEHLAQSPLWLVAGKEVREMQSTGFSVYH